MVAFRTKLDTGLNGIFSGSGGPTTTIAACCNIGDLYVYHFPQHVSINNTGTVAFIGFTFQLPGGDKDFVFTGNGGPLTVVAESKDGDPPDEPFRVGSFAGPAINDAGTVAFFAERANGEENGIFTGNGAPIVTNSGPLETFPLMPRIDSSGIVFFAAGLDTGAVGIFRHNGGTMTTIADSSGTFDTSFGRPSINDAGMVAFSANLDSGGDGIFIYKDETVTNFVNSSGSFAPGFGVSINSLGKVAFTAQLDSNMTFDLGIYTGPNPIFDRVIEPGNALFGSTLVTVGEAKINDNGQIAFTYGLADGRQGIAVAEPGNVIYWDDPSGGSFNDAMNWNPARVPGVDDIAIFDTGAEEQYVVTFPQDNDNEQIVVRDKVKLDFTSLLREYTLFNAQQAVIIEDRGALLLESGELTSYGDVMIGNGTNGSLIVSDLAVLSTFSRDVLVSSDNQTVSLFEVDGGEVDVAGGAVRLGVGEGSILAIIGNSGMLKCKKLIVGEQSQTALLVDKGDVKADEIRIGAQGNGSVTLLNQAKLETGQAMIGGSGSKGAEISMASGATWTVDGDLNIAGGMAAGQSATLAVANSILTVLGNFNVGESSSGVTRIDLSGSTEVVISENVAIAGDDSSTSMRLLSGATRIASAGDVTVGGNGLYGTLSGVIGARFTANNFDIRPGGNLRGRFRAVGQILRNGGYVATGFSAGVLTVEGNYVQTSTGTLQIEIGGLAADTEYDQLVVTGDVNLNGTLRLEFINGFLPKLGDTFDFLQVGGSLTGDFSQVQIRGIHSDWDFEFVRGGTNLQLRSLSNAAPVLPGDFNEDGSVDAADYVVWRNGQGTLYTEDDHQIWRANFGRTSGNAAAQELFSVPEPTALVHLVFGMLATSRRRVMSRRSVAAES
jgi:hypothetical protein